MEPFLISVNECEYSVSLQNEHPLIFNVTNSKTRHEIGKHKDGKWVALNHTPFSEPIPLKEIGEAIDAVWFNE